SFLHPFDHRKPERIQLRPYSPQFREKAMIQYISKITDTRRTTRSFFHADNSLDGLRMTKTPLLQPIFDIDELFRQLIYLPIVINICIHFFPRVSYCLIPIIWHGIITLYESPMHEHSCSS